MNRKMALAAIMFVFAALLAVANVLLREWPVPKNSEYSMRTRVLESVEGAAKHSVENIETVIFGHRSFQYSSTWIVNGKVEYLNVVGDVTPIWGDYGYMTIKKQVVTDGLVELLRDLKIPLVLNRQIALSNGSPSYVKLLKNTGSGMCFYHYDSNNMFCFDLD